MARFIKQVFQSLNVFIQSILDSLFPQPTPVYPSITVVRPKDLLVLRFEFINLKLQKGSEEGGEYAYLIPEENAFLAVHFQPQNLAEQAFLEAEGGGGEPLKTPPVKSRLAGSSRLVFKVPAGEGPIRYTLSNLLEKCSEWELSVAPHALPPEPRPRIWIHPKFFSKRFTTLDIAYAKQPLIINGLPVDESRLPFGMNTSTGVAEDQPGSRSLVSGVAAEGVELELSSGSDLTGMSEEVSLSPAERVIEKARIQAWQANSSLDTYVLSPEQAIMNEQIAGIIKLLIRPQLRAPNHQETAIEAPWRLILSPNRYAAWVHALQDVTSEEGVTELWHTRLAVRLEGKTIEKSHWLRTVRAIWTRDPGFKEDDWGHPPVPPDPPDPFRTTLDQSHRHSLVHLTSNYRIDLTSPLQETYKPLPVHTERMMLSTLGAWLNLHGEWSPPSDDFQGGIAVEEWRQRGTMGRDHYVRVVEKGYLLPFGHRASRVEMTERKFHPGTAGNVAYLRKRYFIIVRQPEKLFTYTGMRTPDNRSYDSQMPFTSVRINTRITPNLNDPVLSQVNGYSSNMFWPRVGLSDFYFDLVAEDIDGRQIEFSAPLLFASINGGVAIKPDVMQKAQTDMAGGSVNRRRYSMHGQLIAYAASEKSGDTAYETQDITFSFEVPPDLATLNDLRAAVNDIDIPCAYPKMVKSEVSVPSIKHLVGNSQNATVQFNQAYLENDFKTATNNGQVFLELVGDIPLNFNGQGDRAGGLMQPNFNISGLSRSLGPVGGTINNLTDGSFDPADFFAGLDAKLFGAIDLWTILKPLGVGEIANSLDKVPKFITETMTAVTSLLNDLESLKTFVNEAASDLPAGLVTDLQNDYNAITGVISGLLSQTSAPNDLENALNVFKANLDLLEDSIPALPTSVPADARRRLENLVKQFNQGLADVTNYVNKFAAALQVPKEIKVRFEWKPDLQDWNNIFIASNKGKTALLLIAVELQAASNFKPNPAFSIVCLMENFSIDLIGNLESFIVIHFEKIEFLASSSKKPDVDVVLDEIEFVGVLSFVEAMKDLIPLDGFSDPPSLDVTAEGIKAGFSLALPNIAFGVFSLQNLSLGAAFSLPFIGKPLSVRFNFCERESPFLLTVSMFGGGGFFAITVDPAGVQILEAALEFGASLSIDFGVASGGVTVMAGVYYRMEADKASLAGYFRLYGEVDVLGLISASLELYLELRYEFSSGKCVGKATLTIEVEVFLFSASVSITCERKFAGSNGDPSFEELMAPYTDPVIGPVLPWHEYCAAFA
jgi:hypothetical protein